MQGLVSTPLMARPQDFVLWRSGRAYYAAGRKVFSLSGGDYQHRPQLRRHDHALFDLLSGKRLGRPPNWLRRSPQETVTILIDANILRLVRLEEEAVSFLKSARDAHSGLPMVVSWSGGKDSTVASALAQRAFARERITHVFADTTIELPSTYAYLREFRKANPATPFLIGVPARDFFELCREIGPPSRIQRWCCATHKAAPLTDVLRAVGGDDRVLSVGGLRRSESTRRQAYPRIIDQGKIGLQILLSPLADWSDFDVWLWAVANDLPMNSGYMVGLDRVGCAFCPDSREWSDMIALEASPDYYGPWVKLLTDVARSAGIERPEDYVSSGAWKSRRGGGIGSLGLPGVQKYDVVTIPCESDQCATTYELSDRFSLPLLAELLKPFGSVSVNIHGEEIGHFDVIGPHGSFAVKAIPHWQRIRATFADRRTRSRLEGTLRLQLRKLQACVGCGACAAVCPHGAIVRVGKDYHICEERCSHCLQCARGLKAGCRAAHSLNVKRVAIHA